MSPSAETIDAQPFQLARTGAPPIRFRGYQILEVTTYRPGGTLWYEAGIYEKAAGGFIADIRFYSKRSSESNIYRVRVLQARTEVSAYFDAHDAADDVPAPQTLEDPDLPPAVRVIRAAALAQRVDEARRAYADLLSEVMEQFSGAVDI
ncbi:MAG: hypothetical protein AAGJ32_10930 [Pseudomonadota bacterium]